MGNCLYKCQGIFHVLKAPDERDNLLVFDAQLLLDFRLVLLFEEFFLVEEVPDDCNMWNAHPLHCFCEVVMCCGDGIHSFEDKLVKESWQAPDASAMLCQHNRLSVDPFDGQGSNSRWRPMRVDDIAFPRKVP